MRIARSAPWVLIAAFLVGCTGVGSQAPAGPANAGMNAGNVASSRIASLLMTLPTMVRPDHRRSWVSADTARAKQLLFESDPGTDDVDIFSLPDMKQKGTLTGFDEPVGECSDSHGNVWIANLLKHELVEYSHNGRFLNKLRRAQLEPSSCAINPVNGAIAVTNLLSGSKAGEVLVYSSPSAVPIILSNPEQYYYLFAGYDSHGHLWVDGTDVLGTTVLSRCGSSSCRTIALSGGSIFSPEAVAWDNVNSTWIVFDGSCHYTPATCSYPVSKGGVLGTPTTYISFTGGALCNLIQAAVATTGKRSIVVGADNEYLCGYTNTVDRWNYPAGGTPAKYEKGAVVYPYGAAVSTK